MKEATKQQYEVPVLEELELNNFQVVMGGSPQELEQDIPEIKGNE